MELTKTQIEVINRQCPSNQGIFKEPSGIPNTEKRLVIYTRYKKSGMSGGNYHGDDAEYYSAEPPEDKFKVLDLVLEQIMPNITYLQFKKISDLTHDNTKTQFEYYGNRTEWQIEYIVLEDLFKLLKSFQK